MILQNVIQKFRGLTSLVRNIAVHEYFAIRWKIVWIAATDEVPILRQKIEKILREEFEN